MARLPKAEIARLTGLSAQTVSIIIKQLEADGLLLKEKPKKGQIGQPPVPLSLNPDGAFSVGLKIGRRSADLMLLDLAGGVRGTMRYAYRYPTPQDTMRLFSEGFDIVTGDLRAAPDRTHLRRRHRRTLRDLELGKRSRRPPRCAGGMARFRHQGADRQDISPARSISATTRPPPAPPS